MSEDSVRELIGAHLTLYSSGQGQGRQAWARERKRLDLRWVPYSAEVDRYGGRQGVRIAEDHFQDSSEAVLQILAGHDRAGIPKKSEKYLYALQLTGMLALSAGFTSQALTGFFADYSRHMRLEERDHTLDDQFLTCNRETLLRHFSRMVGAYTGRVSLPGKLTGEWHERTRATCRVLTEVLEASDSPYRTIHQTLGVNAKYVLVVQSYIHMTLNRLGFWGPAEENIVAVLRDVFTGVLSQHASTI